MEMSREEKNKFFENLSLGKNFDLPADYINFDVSSIQDFADTEAGTFVTTEPVEVHNQLNSPRHSVLFSVNGKLYDSVRNNDFLGNGKKIILSGPHRNASNALVTQLVHLDNEGYVHRDGGFASIHYVTRQLGSGVELSNQFFNQSLTLRRFFSGYEDGHGKPDIQVFGSEVVSFRWYKQNKLHRLDGPSSVRFTDKDYTVEGFSVPEDVAIYILNETNFENEKLFELAMKTEKFNSVQLYAIKNFAASRMFKLYQQSGTSIPLFTSEQLYQMYTTPHMFCSEVKLLMEQQPNFETAWKVVNNIANIVGLQH